MSVLRRRRGASRLAPQPAEPPVARPGPPFTDLLGRQPVRITVEDGDLVGYGFSHQRVAVPAAAVSKVVLYRGQSLILLDHDRHMLLKAAGGWDSWNLRAVCASAGIPLPTRVSRYGSYRRSAGGKRKRKPPPKYRRARDYRRLRVRPRGYVPAMIGLVCLAVFLAGLGVFAGVQFARALPGSIGSVRNLIGIAGGAAGAAAGLWLFTVGVLAAIRWSAASLEIRSPAPWSPFYRRGQNLGRGRQLLTAAMVLAVLALVGWGPGVGIVTLVHGFSDQALVSHLRADGVPAPGIVMGIPQYSTDSDGNTEVTYQPNLVFNAGAQQVLTPDPAIGGRLWDISPAIVTVVYDPARPATAAVAGQLSGSPWGGAPLGNLISGALLTLALPVLTWRTVLRIRKRRRASRDDLLEGIW